MSKKTPALKNYEETIKPFSFILENAILSNSYDSKNRLTGYIIIFLINRLGKDKALNLIQNNKDKFIDLFLGLENNKEIEATLNEFQTSLASAELISQKQKVFESFNNDFIALIESLNIDLGLDKQTISEFIYTGLIYVLYSLVDCQLDKDIKHILIDPQYENKLTKIINNTKLFSNLRQLALKHLGSNVSDFIGLINGLTPNLSK